jgi:hypothetical protein
MNCTWWHKPQQNNDKRLRVGTKKEKDSRPDIFTPLKPVITEQLNTRQICRENKTNYILLKIRCEKQCQKKMVF